MVFIIWARFGSSQQFFSFELGWRTLFAAIFFLVTIGMLIGYWTRLFTFFVGAAVFVIYEYFGIFLGEFQVSSHMYWLGIAPLLLCLTPCDKSYSLDRWLALQRASEGNLPPPVESGNLWGLRLIVVQLSMMYFWTALDKCQIDFISGDRLEAIFMVFYANLIDIDAYGWLFILLAWVVMTLEFALAFGMPFGRTRRYLVGPGLLLHASFYVLLPVRTYSITIILLYLAYFNADRIHDIINQLSGYPRKVATTPKLDSSAMAPEVVAEH
jgi:hypothetical protein